MKVKTFDWDAILTLPRKPQPPEDAIDMKQVMEKTGLSNKSCRDLMAKKVSEGALETGTFFDEATARWKAWWWPRTVANPLLRTTIGRGVLLTPRGHKAHKNGR